MGIFWRFRTHRRRAPWRRRALRKTLNRHPVSLTRRRLGTTFFFVLFAGLSAYHFSTEDAAIRRRAVSYLREVTSGDVRVGQARFSMFGGITLKDVEVATPYSDALDPSAVDFDTRRIFRASSLTLIHNPWRLLFGAFRIERIIATQPEITLVRNIDTGVKNWRLLLGYRDAHTRSGSAHRPTITLRGARVVIVTVDATGRHEMEGDETGGRPGVELDADVRPHGQIESAYCIDVRRLRDPAERTTVILSPDDRLLTNAPFVDVRTLGLQLPQFYQRLFRRIGLEGEIKLSRVTYDTLSPNDRDDQIELRNVRCSLPLALFHPSAATSGPATRPGADAPSPAVLMTDIHGTLKLRGTRLGVDLAGEINGALCRLKGTVDPVDEGRPAEIGIDLAVRCDGLPAPEGELRGQLLADEHLPKGFRKFLRDYDPHGPFAVDGRLIREPGSGGGLAFQGELHALGVVGRYHRFPYEVQDLQGLIRFDGKLVEIEHLRGRHGSGTLDINGRIDRTTRRASVDVTIEAATVPLDVALYEALSDRYRDVFRKFNPRGTADIHLHLHRPGAVKRDPEPPWSVAVAADLVDAQVTFEQFPYPLDGVFGQVRVEDGRLRFNGLTGQHGDGSVRIDGDASMRANAPPDVELRIEARSIRLDEALASALPADGRGALAQFQPDGTVDLLGTASLHDRDVGVVYDFRADLADASIRYDQIPYAIEDVHGTLHIRPDDVTIMDLRGRHGSATIVGRGAVHRRPGGFLADLEFDCHGLSLDRELYDTLPKDVRSAWDRLDLAGTGHVKTHIYYSVCDAAPTLRYRSEIEIADARLRFDGLPLTLRSVAAKALLTERRIEIVSLRGRVGDGDVQMTGAVDLTSPGWCGTFEVDATDMTFNDALVSALPPALARYLEAAHAAGQFNLHLDPIHFEADASGKTRWQAAGRLALSDTSADLGLKLRGATGDLVGRVVIGEDGAVDLDADADLERVTLSHWKLENARAELRLPAGSRMLSITDASAELYEGTASGSAEVDFPGSNTEYRLAVTVRDARIGPYLASLPRRAHAAKDRKSPKPTQGYIYGNIFLRGRTGPVRRVDGGGELFLRQAQVWKLPLVWSIFQVLNLTPDENVFHDGRLKFFITDDTLTLHELDLQGKAMSFVGGGRMDLKNGRLDVTLLAGSPIRFRVPVLSDLLEGASRELMEVRVTGTLAEPDLSPRPLKSLRKALESLFPPPPPRAEATSAADAGG